MRVSTDGDRQVMDLQRDGLLAAGVDERHVFEDRASGSRPHLPTSSSSCSSSAPNGMRR
jgi:hypothetical protein